MYRHSIAGLRFTSNIHFSLRELRDNGDGGADINFTLKATKLDWEAMFPTAVRIGDIRNGAGYPSIAVYRVATEYLLDCHNSHKRIRFVMPRDGRWIDSYAEAGTRTEDIELWLFALVLSFVLQARGVFSLHAAAVKCHERGVAFLGANGHGKTTLAFFFLTKKHSLITDDVLPLVQQEAEVFALPASDGQNGNVNSSSEWRYFSIFPLELPFSFPNAKSNSLRMRPIVCCFLELIPPSYSTRDSSSALSNAKGGAYVD